MMRTNKTIHQEMSGLVLSLIPYRLYVNYPDDIRYLRSVPSGRISEGIQHVEIHWHNVRLWERQEMEDRPRVPFVEPWDTDRRRRRCLIYFEGPLLGTASWVREQDVRSLMSLREFDEVVVRVVSVGRPSAAGRVKEWVALRSLCGLEKGMRWALGSVECRGWDSEGPFIRFRPGERAVDSCGPPPVPYWCRVMNGSSKPDEVAFREIMELWHELDEVLDGLQIKKNKETAERTNKTDKTKKCDSGSRGRNSAHVCR